MSYPNAEVSVFLAVEVLCFVTLWAGMIVGAALIAAGLGA